MSTSPDRELFLAHNGPTIRVYIAGPISGVELHNEGAFAHAAEHLGLEGFEAVNPFDLVDVQHDGELGRRHYLKVDLAALLDCDAVALLPGWQDSVGALHEVETAFLAEIPCAELDEFMTGTEPTWLTADELPPAIAANLLVHGSRQRDYTHPRENFRRIAAGWEVILGQPLTSRQIALCMTWLKIARDVGTPKHDNLVDIAGYAETAAMADRPAP